MHNHYDGGRSFYKPIDEELVKLGATKIIGEEAIYAFHEGKERRLN